MAMIVPENGPESILSKAMPEWDGYEPTDVITDEVTRRRMQERDAEVHRRIDGPIYALEQMGARVSPNVKEQLKQRRMKQKVLKYRLRGR